MAVEARRKRRLRHSWKRTPWRSNLGRERRHLLGGERADGSRRPRGRKPSPLRVAKSVGMPKPQLRHPGQRVPVDARSQVKLQVGVVVEEVGHAVSYMSSNSRGSGFLVRADLGVAIALAEARPVIDLEVDGDSELRVDTEPGLLRVEPGGSNWGCEDHAVVARGVEALVVTLVPAVRDAFGKVIGNNLQAPARIQARGLYGSYPLAPSDRRRPATTT